MTPTAFFQMLGAPLKNHRWSWGAVRPADGAIFLRVWEDRTRWFEGVKFVKVTHRASYRGNESNPGYREREEHVRKIARGAPSWLIFGTAVDENARPRKILAYNFSQVFPGGRLIESDGEMWLEVLPGVRVQEVRRPASTR